MTSKPPTHSERYDEALLWAAQLHRTQARKGKRVPYISHLMAVSGLVWEDGGTEDQVPGKNDVRAAWQILPVEAKSHPNGVQDPTDGQFRGGVLPTDRRQVA